MSTPWPPLPFDAWRDTLATLHRYLQVVGKIRLARTPLVNHFWNVALHLTSRGLTTRPMPIQERTFEIEVDFVDHNVIVRTSDGAIRALALIPRPVADFHHELLAILASLGIQVAINDHPVEIPTEAIAFHADRLHGSYDPEYAGRCWRILAHSAVVLEEFRARFVGKSSPVHFFWGSFDLALSRFSGRRAPARAGADLVTRESYSHEVISVGFWPGDARVPEPAYYGYTSPTPAGLAQAQLAPVDAFWHPGLGEFLLPYEAVRTARDPRRALLEFFQSSYEAGATLAGWDRSELERRVVPRPHPSVSPPPAH